MLIKLLLLGSRFTKFILLLFITLVLANCASNETTPTSKAADTIKIDRRPTTLSNAEKIEYQQAKAALDAKDYKRARTLLVKLSKRHPSNDAIQGNLAITYYNFEDFDSAKKHASIANSLNSKNPKTLNLLGLLSIQDKKFQDAESFYKSALKIDNAHANAHFNLAVLCDIYYQDVDRAYEHYSRYLLLVNGADKEIKDWVEQLKYSLTQ